MQRPAAGKILTDVNTAGLHGAEPARGAWLGRGCHGRKGTNSRQVKCGFGAQESNVGQGYRFGDYLQKDN